MRPITHIPNTFFANVEFIAFPYYAECNKTYFKGHIYSMKSDGVYIQDISSKQIRNILRGLVNQEKKQAFKKATKKIHLLASPNEFKKVHELFRTNILYSLNPISRDFPDSFYYGVDAVLGYTETDITSKANKNSKKISSIISDYRKLLYHVSIMELENALRLISEILERGGFSLFLLRIVYFIKSINENGENENIIKLEIKNTLNKMNVNNSKQIKSALEELCNFRVDYISLAKRILSITDELPNTYILHSFINYLPASQDDFYRRLSSFYQYSLIDSLIYMFSISRTNLYSLDTHTSKIDESVVNELAQLSKMDLNLPQYYGVNDTYSGYEFFRNSFLLIELDIAFRFNLIHSSYYNDYNNKKTSSFTRNLIGNYFSGVNSVKDIQVQEGVSVNIGFNTYNNQTSGIFENSTALIYALLKDEFNPDDVLQFIRIMSYTRDLAFTCPNYLLHSILSKSSNDELNLVLWCLISMRSKSDMDEFNLRWIFQELIQSRFDDNIVDALEYIYSLSPSVAEHLISVCDETFISKLFHITAKPIAAIESRANILNWYGHKTDDKIYIERAKNLKIDIQISKEKGIIDDSRIYVDPLKYTQWINDNILDQFTLLFDSICKEDEVVVAPNWQKVKTGLSPSEQVFSLIAQCYDIFCNNPLFGVASFLGRRIRHGTFKETLIKDIDELYKSQDYSCLVRRQDFSSTFSVWHIAYLAMTDALKTSKLFFHEPRHPKGIMSSEINTPLKQGLAFKLFSDFLFSYRKNNNCLEFPYLIMDYCWRMVEEELTIVKKHLNECKSQFGFFNSKSLNIKEYNGRTLSDFTHDLNAITVENFRVVTSWFNKPSIASHHTDLVILFKAVISEVKGVVAEFKPAIRCSDGEYIISGGLYFSIYDALYVLIYNAAKHGNPNGKIDFNIEHNPKKGVINISISNEISIQSNPDDVSNSIDTYLYADYQFANIFEGKSGIKKLRSLEADGYISNVNYIISNKIVTFSFDYAVEF